MFKIISHTADVGLEISAESIESLFIEAARGWKYCVIEDSLTQASNERKIRLNATNPEDLMVQWLNELNFYLTVNEWILDDVIQCRIECDDTAPRPEALNHTAEWSGDFLISGEPLDYEKHEICIEIKSVTYHQLEIQKQNNGYKTRIIFDI